VVALLIADLTGSGPVRESFLRDVTAAGLRPVVRVGTTADPAERLALLVGQALRDQVSAIVLVVTPTLPADVVPVAKAAHDAGVPLVLGGADEQKVDQRARMPGHYVAAYVPAGPDLGARAAQAALQSLVPAS
jgi:ABC-type sugar transport system substrate-binding protein